MKLTITIHLYLDTYLSNTDCDTYSDIEFLDEYLLNISKSIEYIQFRLSAPQVLLWCPSLLGLGAQRPRLWVSMSVCVSATAPHKSAYRN